MVALDASPTLVAMAATADPAGRYLVADAAALPFADGCFDTVVAYNSLMDVADMPAAVQEASRVLEPGGRLCVCVTHPTADAGKFQSKEPDAPFVIGGAYLGRHRFEDVFERDGLQVTFAGWRYSLEEYARALEDAGLPDRPRPRTAPPPPAALTAPAPATSAGSASPTSSTSAPSRQPEVPYLVPYVPCRRRRSTSLRRSSAGWPRLPIAVASPRRR